MKPLKRVIAGILAVSTTLQLAGCTVGSTQRVSPSQLRRDPTRTEPISGITTSDGRDIALASEPPATVVNDTLVGVTRAHHPIEIPMSSVQHVWVSRENGWLTGLATLGATVAVLSVVGGIVAAAMAGNRNSW